MSDEPTAKDVVVLVFRLLKDFTVYFVGTVLCVWAVWGTVLFFGWLLRGTK